MTDHRTIWKNKPEQNYRWIIIRYKNGEKSSHNADYIQSVEYIENEESGIPE